MATTLRSIGKETAHESFDSTSPVTHFKINGIVSSSSIFTICLVEVARKEKRRTKMQNIRTLLRKQSVRMVRLAKNRNFDRKP